MQTKIVVLNEPEVETEQDRVLAAGMRAIWASGLFAGGADLFVPEAAADRCAVVAAVPRGHHLTHDGRPLSRGADAIVTTRFVRGPGSLRITVLIERPGRPFFMRSGRTFRGATAELRAMATTLHTIAHALGLDVPPHIGWRELTSARCPADGLADVLAAGRGTSPERTAPHYLH